MTYSFTIALCIHRAFYLFKCSQNAHRISKNY
nr:MAG TPA: hypothetical protein [Caudoviricetes sp.]